MVKEKINTYGICYGWGFIQIKLDNFCDNLNDFIKLGNDV